MKLFNEEIKKFEQKLINKENFSLARFGDGEMIAMKGDTIASGYGEWMTNGSDVRYEYARNLLKKAFQFQDPGYHVGIACPCCVGQENFVRMKNESGQPDDQLTYANVFVNSNYSYFLEKFIPIFQSREIVLVANKTINTQNVPFSGQFIPVGYNAWIDNLDLVDQLRNHDFHNKLFLFACGPLGKILAQQLWEHNKNNTYLDIGSTLHPFIGGDINIRGYYQQDSFHSKLTCKWSI